MSDQQEELNDVNEDNECISDDSQLGYGCNCNSCNGLVP